MEEGLFLAFYAHKDKKGLGQPRASLKSALVSGNSVSTGGQEMTSVTLYQPNTSNLGYSHTPISTPSSLVLLREAPH